MKKIILILIAVLFINHCFAQEPVSKKGIPYLPHKGDWGIGFDAISIIKYAGNLFHDSNKNQDISIYPLTITARYFHRDNIAYRFDAMVNVNSTKTDSLVPKIGSTNGNEQVADETKENHNSLLLNFGIARYVGKSRVRGYYGGEAGAEITGTKTSIDYGNPLSAQNTNSRIIQIKDGTVIAFGARAFLGAEIFVSPKIAVSAEYGFSPFVFSIKTKNEVKGESWDGSAVKTESVSTIGKVSSFTASTDNNNGAISLLFYFSR